MKSNLIGLSWFYTLTDVLKIKVYIPFLTFIILLLFVYYGAKNNKIGELEKSKKDRTIIKKLFVLFLNTIIPMTLWGLLVGYICGYMANVKTRHESAINICLIVGGISFIISCISVLNIVLPHKAKNIKEDNENNKDVQVESKETVVGFEDII